MNNTLISVVIPLYNKQSSLLNTVKSVLNQTYEQFEIIIVNDGSTDKSFEIASEIIDTRIRLINKENGGVSSARNVGVKNAKSDFIAFLDADDIWYDNYLENAIRFISNNNKIKVIATNYYRISSNTNLIAHRLDTGKIADYFKTPCISASSVIIHKDVFTKVGFFSETISNGEDLHMWFRIADKFEIYYINRPLVKYMIEGHLTSYSDFRDKEIEKDIVWHLDELDLNYSTWEKYKISFLLKTLKPYYVCDNHLNNVKLVLNRIGPAKYINPTLLFYLLPRAFIVPLYKYFKYLRSVVNG